MPARLNYIEAVELMTRHRTQHIEIMVAESNCQFKKELLFPGTITIDKKIIFVKNTSFSLEHTLTNDASEPIAIAKDILVFDFTKKKECLIPEEIRMKIG